MFLRPSPAIRNGSILFDSYFALLILLALAVTCIGCRGKDNGVSRQNRIQLEGIKYLSDGKRVVHFDSTSAGLANLGDIDGDGCDDILIASQSPRPGESVSKGWIEAYSGRSRKRIWQASGMDQAAAEAAGFERGFRLKDAFVVTDIDGDRVPDIYAIDDNSRQHAFWISGKTGRFIGRFPIEGRDWWRRPAGVRKPDGGPEQLVFVVNRASNNPPQPKFEFAESPSLKPVGVKVVEWGDRIFSGFGLLANDVPDQNGDGVRDWIFRNRVRKNSTEPVLQWGLAVFCGREFSIVRELRTDQPRISGTEYWTLVEDLPSNGKVAMVLSTDTGEGPQNRASSLRAISLDDGEVLWQLIGTDVAGGRESFTVNRAGDRSEVIKDVEFGSAVVVVGDINGDGVTDVATSMFQPSGRVIVIISGTDGSRIRTIDPNGKDLKVPRDPPLIRIRHGDKSWLVTTATNRKNGELELLMLEL